MSNNADARIAELEARHPKLAVSASGWATFAGRCGPRRVS